jgi:anti-anti-sigma factor
MLNWTTHDVGGVLVITLEPSPSRTDDRQSEERQKLYESIQTRPDGRFAVDLGRVDYVSSADVGFLITVRRRTDVRKGKLVLFDVNPYIRNSLATMKLLPLFPIADDLTGALMLLPSGES